MAVRSPATIFCSPATFYRRWHFILSTAVLTPLFAGFASITLAQEPPATEPQPASEVRRVDQVSTSEFSVPYADQLVVEGNQAISNQDFTVAISKLSEARELYNQLSLYYQELSEMFFGVDTRQNRDNRDKALEAAQKRDEATYQLALIHRSQNNPEEAIPLFMEVLRSQQPTRDLGEQAYQQLFEMGFVEAPYQAN